MDVSSLQESLFRCSDVREVSVVETRLELSVGVYVLL